MPIQLARFTDRCADLSQNSVVGEPKPTLQQGNGGYADWVIVVLHCLREYLNQPCWRLIDILHEDL